VNQEGTIDVNQYGSAIRRALPRIVVIALIAAVVAAAATFALRPKAYTASTTIIASDTLNSGQPIDAATIGLRLGTVSSLTGTTSVLRLAVSKLHDTRLADLRSTVSSAVDPTTNAIVVSAKARAAATAAARANAVASALIQTERTIEQRVETQTLRAALAAVRQLRAQGATPAEIQAAEAQVATLPATSASSAGEFVVVQTAQTPKRAAAPAPWFSAALVFLAVLIVGVLVVVARQQFAQRILSSRDLAHVYSLPLLATIPLVRGVKPGYLPKLPQSVRSPFYALASGVRASAEVGSTNVVFVVSATRREGRTTVAAGLAQALSLSGSNVLVLGADLRSPPGLHSWFGGPQSPGLIDVLEAGRREELAGAAPVKEMHPTGIRRTFHSSIQRRYGSPDVMPSGAPGVDPSPLLFGNALPEIFDLVRKLDYQFVIVDTPAGLDTADLHALGGFATLFVVVVRPDRLNMNEALEFRDLLGGFPGSKVGLVGFEQEASAKTWPANGARTPVQAPADREDREEVASAAAIRGFGHGEP
jgi:Mrp family chromosome partitioning ATPase